ncbi:MAG: BNR-4 repeat-containing protein [Limnochordia bacterium]
MGSSQQEYHAELKPFAQRRGTNPKHELYFHRITMLLVLILASWLGLTDATRAEAPWEFGIQTGGAVYFDADPGILEITVRKKDQIARRDWIQDMRLVLVGPDRRVVAETVIPDYPKAKMNRAHEWSEEQSAHLSVPVPVAGVYMMLVAVDQDSYGRSVLWTFSTNAKRYLIDAGMGHVDGARKEEIVLSLPGQPGRICFKPTQPISKITLTSLPGSVASVTLLDPNDKEHISMAVRGGKAEGLVVTNSQTQNGVWQIVLPTQQVRASIEGVTYWNEENGISRMPLWTTAQNRYFDLLPYRWLLTPYRGTEVVKAGAVGTVALTLFNNSTAPMEVNLSVTGKPLSAGVFAKAAAEAQTGALRVSINQSQITLQPQQTQQVQLRYHVTGAVTEEQHVHVLAQVQESEFQTYSTISFVPEGSGSTPMHPIQLQPFANERDLFGYAPDYPAGTEPYFDSANRPWMVAEGKLWRRGDQGWEAIEELFGVLSKRHGVGDWSIHTGRIGFDGDCGAYIVVRQGSQIVLARVSGDGKTIHSVPLPGGTRGALTLETFTGHNGGEKPPAILRYVSTGAPPRDPKVKWGVDHRLTLIVPHFDNGQLTISEPVLVSDRCIGIADHSGLTSPLVSRGDQIFLIWGEASDVAAKHPGVPTYAASYNRKTGEMTKPALVGYAPPANDVHNVPGIVIDSQGYLHAILGAHNKPFQYARSLQPHSTDMGWSQAEKVAAGYEQTYVGVVVDANDILHLVSRIWRRGSLFPGLHDTALVYQTKKGDGPWSKPQPFLLPATPHYSVYYQRLTIDRTGRLFVSYDYWPTWSAYRSELIGQGPTQSGFGRALLVSEDQGDHWAFVRDQDF